MNAARKASFALLVVLFTGFIAYGLANYHYEETALNGQLICLSCIGVGG